MREGYRGQDRARFTSNGELHRDNEILVIQLKTATAAPRLQVGIRVSGSSRTTYIWGARRVMKIWAGKAVTRKAQ